MIMAHFSDLIAYTRKLERRIDWAKLSGLYRQKVCYILADRFVNPRTHSEMAEAGCRLLLPSYWAIAFREAQASSLIVWGVKKNRYSKFLDQIDPVRLKFLLPNKRAKEDNEHALSDWTCASPKSRSTSLFEKLHRDTHRRDVAEVC